MENECVESAADPLESAGDAYSPIVGVGVNFQCHQCPQVTKPAQLLLRQHFEAVHLPHRLEFGDATELHCPLEPCATSKVDRSLFKGEEDLLTHMLLLHSSRVFICHFCGKVGRTLHCLRVHVRIHTGERPYRCQICHRCFSDASSQRRHERVHTGEKPYQCPLCPRTIARKDNVKVHLRSHLKDMPTAAAAAIAEAPLPLNFGEPPTSLPPNYDLFSATPSSSSLYEETPANFSTSDRLN